MAKVVIDGLLVSAAFRRKPLVVVIRAMSAKRSKVSRDLNRADKLSSKLSEKLTGKLAFDRERPMDSWGGNSRKRIGTHHPIEGLEGRPLPLIMQGDRSRIPHNRR